MSSVPEHIVVVGAGLAGLRTAEQLRAVGHHGSITLIGAERHAPYDRPPLSKQVLTGAWPPERTALTDRESLAELGLTLRLGSAAVSLQDTTVQLADGDAVRGDAVVIATGLSSRRLPGQPEGVHTLRTLDDACALRDALSNAHSLLVIGSGFIGAEASSAARTLGLKATMIESLPTPLTRALGQAGGEVCARLATEAGVQLRCGTSLVRFVDEHAAVLDDGSTLSADVLLVGVGGMPQLSWLDGSELDTTNGIACDATGRAVGTSGVWAVGDVAAWRCPQRGGHHRNEHWNSASDQAAVVACDILGAERPELALPYFWSDQFGLKIQLLGHPELADSVITLHGDIHNGPVKGTVLGYFSGDKLVAVTTFGAPRLLARYRNLVSTKADRAAALAFAHT